MKRKWFFLFAICASSVTLQAHSDTIIRQFIDTVTSVTLVPDSTLKQREEMVPADSTDRRGHYIQAHVGIGYGTLGYHLAAPVSHVYGSVSAIFQAQYAYYFHQNWGVGAGLWFTEYMSYTHLGGQFKWYDQMDTDTEQHYDHIADVRRWVEHETLHNIGIPISVQCRYIWESLSGGKNLGIFGALGVAPSFTVLHKYRVTEGTIAHSGYYPAWDLTLEDLHEFKVKNYENDPRSRGEVNVKPQVDLFADLGLLVELTRQIDIFVGGYANVSLNSANNFPTVDKHGIGWQDEVFTFMEPYVGLYNTSAASASHPWEAGVKVGLHWHYVDHPTPQMVDYYDYFTRPDTTIQYIARQDTSIVEQPDEEYASEEGTGPARQTRMQMFAQEIEPFSKIYFPFDSYKLTNKAKRRINQVYSVISKESDIHIAVCGHASTEGQDPYNDNLSRQRANAVAQYLIKKGIDKDRITIRFFGSRVPNEDTEYEEMRRDRRVEVIIIDENEQTEK